MTRYTTAPELLDVLRTAEGWLVWIIDIGDPPPNEAHEDLAKISSAIARAEGEVTP